MKKFSAYTAAGSVFGVFAIFLFGLWIFSAYNSGRNQIQREICEIRNSTILPSFVDLDSGAHFSGRILDQTEKFTVLLDQTSIYIVSIGDKTRKVDTIDVRGIKCSPVKK